MGLTWRDVIQSHSYYKENCGSEKAERVLLTVVISETGMDGGLCYGEVRGHFALFYICL